MRKSGRHKNAVAVVVRLTEAALKDLQTEMLKYTMRCSNELLKCAGTQ